MDLRANFELLLGPYEDLINDVTFYVSCLLLIKAQRDAAAINHKTDTIVVRDATRIEMK